MAINNPFKRRRESLDASAETDHMEKLSTRRRRTWPKIIAAIVVIAAIAVAVFYIVNYAATSFKITAIETTNALSSRTQDAETKDKFAAAEPIMLYFKYENAPVGATVDFEVKNQNSEVVKNGSTTTLRSTENDAPAGQRYISIVNTGASLSSGKYTAILAVDGRTVKAINFEIE